MPANPAATPYADHAPTNGMSLDVSWPFACYAGNPEEVPDLADAKPAASKRDDSKPAGPHPAGRSDAEPGPAAPDITGRDPADLGSSRAGGETAGHETGTLDTGRCDTGRHNTPGSDETGPPAPPASAPPVPARPAPSRPFEPRSRVCATADMLFTQALLCDRARCRRHRCCSLPGATPHDPARGVHQAEMVLPRCLAGMPRDLVEGFLVILALSVEVEALLAPGALKEMGRLLGSDPMDTDIRAALAVARSCLPRGHPLKAEFQDFWRRDMVSGEP